MYVMRGSGGSQVDGLVDLVKCVAAGRRDLTVVEIGSFAGESASILLSTGLVSRIYCVDPWRSGYDADDAASHEDMSAVERAFDTRHGGDARVVKVKGTVDDFVSLYINRGSALSVDLVYIDACHTYDAVRHDIDVALSDICPSVALAGHDYGCPNLQGVSKAVDELFGRPDRTFSDNSWVVSAERAYSSTIARQASVTGPHDALSGAWGMFDGIFVLCCTTYKNRFYGLRRELSRICMPRAVWLYDYPSPLDAAGMQITGFTRPDNVGNYKCTLAHYKALKIASGLGMTSILILEDDIRVVTDTSVLLDALKAIPADYGCAKFEWIPNVYSPLSWYVSAVHNASRAAGAWFDASGIPTSGGAMVAYSKRAIDRKIMLMESDMAAKKLNACDTYEYDPRFTEGLKVYCSIPMCAVQQSQYPSVWGSKNYLDFVNGCGYGGYSNSVQL